MMHKSILLLCLIIVALVHGAPCDQEEGNCKGQEAAPEEVANLKPQISSMTIIAPEKSDDDTPDDIVEAVNDDEDDDLEVDPATGRILYSAFRVVRAKPTTQDHLKILKLIKNGVEDFWTPIPLDVASENPVDMLISPSKFDLVTSLLNCSDLPWEVTIDDVQEKIDKENEISEDEGDDNVLVGRPASKTSFPTSLHSIEKRQVSLGSLLRGIFGLESREPKVRKSRHFNENPQSNPNVLINNNNNQPQFQASRFCTHRSGFHFRKYHRLDRFENYLNCLAQDHTDKVQVIKIGNSYEGRPLNVVKISAPGSSSNKQVIWIDGGIHAREWISPASVIYMIHQLVENYDSNRDILDKFDIYIMPIVNPDGYEFTHTHNRMWRKTRSNPDRRGVNSKCIGTDPNRNWGYKWGGEGASVNPCSETYRGQSPFSESETRAVRDIILPMANRIKLFLTFHSYGQYILYPWGYTDRGVPPNYRDLHSLAQVAGDAMYSRSRHRYTIGSAAQVLYPAAGGSDDWAKGGAKIEYSYTVELPDTGRTGFLLPPNQIESTVDSAWSGVAAMIRELKRRV